MTHLKFHFTYKKSITLHQCLFLMKAVSLYMYLSYQSENIRQFISTPNLRESAKQLQDEMNIFIANIKVIEKQSSPIQQSSASSAPHRLEEAAIRQIENQAQKIFEFVHSIIEITVQSHEQYNQLVQLFNQAENRYTKLYGLHQSGQK